MAERTTIQVTRNTCDHLAERGMTLAQLVEQLATQQLTDDQIAERVAATRAVPRERMGCTLTDQEFDRGLDVLADIRAIAAEKMLVQRNWGV